MTDPAKLRSYRIELPNLIDDSDLSVYAFRLYVHIKRVTGPNGTCYEATRTLAEKCQMSMGKVSAAKQELIKKNLIRQIGERPTRGGIVPEFVVVDIWQENLEHYASVQDVNTNSESVHHVNASTESVHESVHESSESVHHVNERINNKNKHEKKEHVAQRASAPAQPSDHQRLMTLYAEALPDKRIPNGAIEGRAAKQILAAGYTPEQALEVYQYLKRRDFYADQHLSLTTVNKQMGAVLDAIKRGVVAGRKNGHQPSAAFERARIGYTDLDKGF